MVYVNHSWARIEGGALANSSGGTGVLVILAGDLTVSLTSSCVRNRVAPFLSETKHHCLTAVK